MKSMKSTNGNGVVVQHAYAAVEKLLIQHQGIVDGARLVLDLLRAEQQSDNAPIIAATIVGGMDRGRRRRKLSKAQQKRETIAALLAQFNQATPSRPAKMDARAFGPYVRRGYLKRKGDGYVRTVKAFTV